MLTTSLECGGTNRYHSSSFFWKHVLQIWQAISAREGDFKKGKKNFKIVLKIDTGLTLANVVSWGVWTHRICIREIKPHKVELGISRKPLNFTGNKVLGVMLLLQGVPLFQTQSNAEAWGPVQDCKCHLWPVLHIRQPFSRRCHKVLHCCFYTTHRCNMPCTLLVGIPPLRTGHNNQSTTAIKPYVCACLWKIAFALTSQGNWNHQKALVQHKPETAYPCRIGSAEESVKDTCYAPEAEEFELQVRHAGGGHGRPNSDTSQPKADMCDVALCSVGKQERCTW